MNYLDLLTRNSADEEEFVRRLLAVVPASVRRSEQYTIGKKDRGLRLVKFSFQYVPEDGAADAVGVTVSFYPLEITLEVRSTGQMILLEGILDAEYTGVLIDDMYRRFARRKEGAPCRHAN